MIKIINESNESQDYCKYIVDEIFSAFYDRNPQYDRLDEAIDIIDKYISDTEYEYIEEEWFSKDAIYKILSNKPLDILSKIEDELSKVGFIDFVKYSDKDAYNEYENQLLDYEDY